jgi:two-component system response regulator AtoC
MHILLVDDNQDTRHLFSMAFTLDGHRTQTASNAADAIELFAKHHIDAMLLDLELPYIHGFTVLEAIRALPLGRDVPVIMFSAYHDMDKEDRARELGAYALLRKPMFPNDVLEVIQEAVDARALKATPLE